MSERQRLFFALWPDDELRETLAPLQQLKQECGGRAVPTANVHITLNFLGNVDANTRDCLEQAASEITIPPFQLLLDRYGYWRRPRVMWLGCSDMPEPLLHLVDALNRAVDGCGLVCELHNLACVQIHAEEVVNRKVVRRFVRVRRTV